MNKKINLSLLLLSFSLNVSAQNVSNEIENELPQPVSGIHVVPDSQITVSEVMRNKIKLNSTGSKKLEYNYSESPYPRQLISVKYSAKNEIRDNQKNTNPYDTHMKESFSDIKLAFPFNGLSIINNENVIGYVAAGSYNGGWTGVKEFFSDTNVGTCSLTLYNIALSKGGARLGKSAVTYRVNKKPTTTSISGSINSGFLYTVSWYDNTFVHVFECANMSFNKGIMNKMITMANQMDKEIS